MAELSIKSSLVIGSLYNLKGINNVSKLSFTTSDSSHTFDEEGIGEGFVVNFPHESGEMYFVQFGGLSLKAIPSA